MTNGSSIEFKDTVFVPDFQFLMRADFMPEYDRWFVEDSSLPVLLYENIEVAGREVEFAFACIELNADREGLYSRVYKDALSGQTLVVFND